MKSLRNMPESLETVNSGRFGNRSAVFLENNSSMTSQLSLNLGIFRTDHSILIRNAINKPETHIQRTIFAKQCDLG